MKKFFQYVYQTFIFDPLAGGNGKVQTSEITQWVLVVMICSASIKEGKSAEQLYPDIYWTMIYLTVAAIAGLKVAFPKRENEVKE